MDLEHWINYFLSLEWLRMQKFCFFFPLKIGMKLYGFTTWAISVYIVDLLAIQLTEGQLCLQHSRLRTKDCLLDVKNNYNFFICTTTKQIIVPQACLAAMSILLLCKMKQPAIAMSWVGCRVVVTAVQLLYLPQWVGHFFPSQPTLVTYTIIVIELYGVLVAINYYTELIVKQGLCSTSSGGSSKTSSQIPVPPAIPNLIV